MREAETASKAGMQQQASLCGSTTACPPIGYAAVAYVCMHMIPWSSSADCPQHLSQWEPAHVGRAAQQALTNLLPCWPVIQQQHMRAAAVDSRSGISMLIMHAAPDIKKMPARACHCALKWSVCILSETR